MVNGQIYFVIPGRLLLFTSPRLGLPPGQQWIDVDGRREFAPPFYADLFEYLGVAAVLRLDSAATYDPVDFTRRRIRVADLRDPKDPAAANGVNATAAGDDAGDWRLSFGELDRLMAHMDATPGLVAVHFPAKDPHARTLIGAYIARRMRPGAGCPPSPSLSPSSPRRRRASAAAAASAAADTFSAREAVAWLHMAHPSPAAGWRRVAGFPDDEPEFDQDDGAELDQFDQDCGESDEAAAAGPPEAAAAGEPKSATVGPVD